MSVISALFSKATSYEEAFKASDISTTEMKEAIEEWYRLFYNRGADEKANRCDRVAYTIVDKITRAMFGEYQASAKDDFTAALLEELADEKVRATHAAMTGGRAFIKPYLNAGRVEFSVIERPNMLIFGKDTKGNTIDIGTAEKTSVGNKYYTLLERRTVGRGGLLTIKNRLLVSDDRENIGRPCPLSALEKYAELPEEYTFTEPMGLGLAEIRCPVPNVVDMSTDPVAVFAAAVDIIKEVDFLEAWIHGEFERGKSRIMVPSDMMERQTINGETRRYLKDTVFTAIGSGSIDSQDTITTFSPALREQSYLATKNDKMRDIENAIGLKRGLLSQVEASERTATEVTSSMGDYSLTIISFQQMWEEAAREAVRIAAIIGRLYRVPGAHDVQDKDVVISWGNGILYDEDKVWTDLKYMVSAGLLRPEIAVGWYFDMPIDTPADLEKVRQKYMPLIEQLTEGDA